MSRRMLTDIFTRMIGMNFVLPLANEVMADWLIAHAEEGHERMLAENGHQVAIEMVESLELAFDTGEPDFSLLPDWVVALALFWNSKATRRTHKVGSMLDHEQCALLKIEARQRSLLATISRDEDA